MSWWTSDRQAYALNYLLANAGLSVYGAAGLVSRWMNVEASGGPASVNPSSGAFGIAQWLGSRLSGIRGNTSFDAQLNYVARELSGTESRAGNVLRSAATAQQGAVGASMYERAEGYNPNTGIDNWTARTLQGISAVLALVNGTVQQLPPVVYNDGGGDDNSGGGVYADSGGPDATGAIPVMLLIGGGLLALYFILK